MGTASTMRRLTPAEVADAFRRHPVTVRNALAAGELHGSQRVKGGRWTVEELCARAWVAGQPCEHQRDAQTEVVADLFARRRRAAR